MSKKRSNNPELLAFGEWLEKRRGAASREQISIRLRALGVPLGGSTLAQYEKGTVWAPDPGVLWGLAKIYDESLELLVDLLRTNRADPHMNLSDLIRHGRTRQQTPHEEGESDVPASARILERRLAQDGKLAEEIHRIIGELGEVANTLAVETDAARSAKTDGRARRRASRR